jgi:hypothetical protein
MVRKYAGSYNKKSQKPKDFKQNLTGNLSLLATFI